MRAGWWPRRVHRPAARAGEGGGPHVCSCVDRRALRYGVSFGGVKTESHAHTLSPWDPSVLPWCHGACCVCFPQSWRGDASRPCGLQCVQRRTVQQWERVFTVRGGQSRDTAWHVCMHSVQCRCVSAAIRGRHRGGRSMKCMSADGLFSALRVLGRLCAERRPHGVQHVPSWHQLQWRRLRAVHGVASVGGGGGQLSTVQVGLRGRGGVVW